MSETPRITLTIALALGAVFAFRSDVFAAPPIAEDTPPDAPEEKAPKRWSPAEARKAVATFDEIFARTEYELPILEEFEKSKAVRDLSAVDHRIVARHLLALLRDRREKIRMETIAGLANMKSTFWVFRPTFVTSP